MVRLVQAMFAVGYVLMAAVGIWFLSAAVGMGSDAEVYTAVFAGSLYALIGIGGLALTLFVALFARLRGGPVLATAPSGALALYFRRSPFMVVTSVLFCAALGGWSASLAVVLHAYRTDGWAWPCVALALTVLWPLVVVPTGRVRPGGLWLTADGLEYRRSAACWSLPWSEVAGVRPYGGSATVVRILPQAIGSGLAAVEPLTLDLVPGARPAVRNTARWAWTADCRAAPGTVCVDCFDLAGGRAVIAATIERYRADARERGRLGTVWSLPRRVAWT